MVESKGRTGFFDEVVTGDDDGGEWTNDVEVKLRGK